MTRWIVSLDGPDATDRVLTGGKAAGLSQLLNAGLPVPEGFVVTTDAFRAHFPAANPHEVPTAPALHDELSDALRSALARHFPDPDTPLAVRSSAMAEDGAAASFAGQHATYYYITPDSLAAAIRQCWLSLWSARARAYRAEQAADSNGFVMAVIVQRMLKARSAGVCFTREPTGRYPDAACIEATWGLGAALVDGRVSPDRLIIGRDGRILQRRTGRKRQMVAAALRDPEASRLEPVPAHLQAADVLSKAQVAEVLGRSLEAERILGDAQDVEWAYEGDRLYLLQSRAVTTTGDPSSAATAQAPGIAGEWILFKPLAENFTEPLTPLSADLFQQLLPPQLARFLDGRLYLNFAAVSRLLPFRWSRQQMADAVLLRGPRPKLHIHWQRLPLALLAGAASYLLDGVSWHRTARLERKSLETFAERCRSVEDRPEMDARGALFLLFFGRAPFEPIGRQAFQVNVSAGRYFLYMAALRLFLERYAPDFDQGLLHQLCSGAPDMHSLQMVEAIRALAHTAAEDPQLAATLAAQAPQGYAQLLADLPADHPFRDGLEIFLRTYGHRCVGELEMAAPRWREDPVTVLQMVRNYLREGPRATADPHALHLVARDALRQALPRRWQQRVAMRMVERIRYYVTLREDTRHYHTMAFATLREKLKQLEQRLIADDRLRARDDLFFLTWKETQALDRGTLDWLDVAVEIRRRRRRHRQLSRELPAETINIEDIHPRAPAACERQVLLGDCASPGSAEGPVRIVTDPTAAASLDHGDILVAPYTDPAWTPLFPIAGAVVVEVGSYLSHAGTVAREYQIPCLVDVQACLSRLRDGQRVRVLASEGRLEILEP